jgi:hypothetical protein
MGEIRNARKILFRKYDGNSALGRTKHKWGCNIRMDFREIDWESIG